MGLYLLLKKLTTIWQEIDRGLSAFAQAIQADPEKIEAVACNIARDNITHSVVQVLLKWNFEIPHNAAALAHEMIVMIHCCVVTMKPLSKVEFLDLSLSCEDVEVSIDCAERDARNLRANLLIDPLCRRMSNGFFQDLIDLFTLSTSFRPDGLHGITLKS